MAISIEQAAQNALARWIARELPGVTVWERWPEANVRLPPRAITVLRAGPRHDELIDPEPIKRVDIPNARGRAVFTWRMRACTQPIQLDVWATSDCARDDLLARLEPVLNASKVRSMPTLGIVGGDPVEHGLALLLADGWEGFASYLFDSPADTNTPDAVQRSEYRATYRGSAAMQLTIDAESPRLARVVLHAKLNGLDEPPKPTRT